MKVTKTKITQKSRQKLFKDLWKIFSKYIRLSNADWRGYVSCVCCGEQHIWNSGNIHAGHWIHDKLDFDERNVHPQCANCNFKYNKNANTLYAIYMARTYGHHEMKKLRKLADTKGNDYTVSEIEKLTAYYTKELKCLEK